MTDTIEKVEPGNFDFVEYINQYSGQSKVDRCKYIAERCPALAVSERSRREKKF